MNPARGSVVMVTPNFYPYIGGAEKQALELSKALQHLGVRIQVLTQSVAGLPKEELVQNLSVNRLCSFGPGLFRSVSFMISTFFWLLRHRSTYKAIHVHLAGSQALAAACAGKLLNKRVVIKLGGGRGIGEIAASSRTWTGRLKLTLLARLKPQFIAVIQELVDEMREYGLSGAPVLVIPNGVDTHHYAPISEQAKKSLRERLNIPPGLCLLYVGRLSEEKRLPLFLSVFAEVLRESKKDGTLILVGRGPEEELLRKKAAEFQLGAHVRFEQPTTEIELFYGACDVFVLPSISEGLSNALLEAMSSGLGILATKVGGMKEAIQDGVTGLLFDKDSTTEMKRQLLRFLQDPSLAAALGAAARRSVLERYDLPVIAQRCMRLYGI